MFDFPIFLSLVHKLGALMFVVWDRWFKEMVFAFDDPNNESFTADLISSHPTTTVSGTIHIKLGFVQPPNSTDLPDFRRTYNVLMNIALVPTKKDQVGIIVPEICDAKDLPKWPNLTRMGWDLDPFVKVSIGEEVKNTRVIRHSRDLVWDEHLLFHVHRQDLTLPIRLAIFDRDRFTPNELIGATEVNIATLVERAAKKDPNTALHPNYTPTMREFELPLAMNPMQVYPCTQIITFR
ncbi:C2 domain-containing protein [Lactarius pseudohatsudake]|nr:C2 domain-containing protein [Lactarius pseudohatsudake]